MSRSKLREKVFQLLFRIAFGSEEEYEEQAALFFADEEQETLTEKEQKQIQDKYDQILAHLDKIDAQINEKSVGWNVSRLGKVELAIMRLAVYEILFDDTIPGSVSINEAVDWQRNTAHRNPRRSSMGYLPSLFPKQKIHKNFLFWEYAVGCALAQRGKLLRSCARRKSFAMQNSKNKQKIHKREIVDEAKCIYCQPG